MADENKSKDLHVLIIGAGITGLALAQALEKIGIRYSIFEKEVKLNYRSNEWTMAIHWALDRLEDLIPTELFANLPSIACNPAIPISAGGNYPIIHGESGDIIAGVPYQKGLRVPRSKMRQLCTEGINVEYGKSLIDIAFNESGQGVIASFEDGSMVHGTIIVGADGPRSRVREFAMRGKENAQVSRFPIWHYNMTVCYGDAAKAKYLRERFPTSYLALSDRSFHAFQSISSMPDGPEHAESWIFHLAMAWLGDPDHSLSHKERLALVKEWANELGEPARSAFTWIPGDTLVHKADISYWIPKLWENREGRITLVGDAAHPMPPYRGQGLNHCICDISHLIDALQGVRANDSTLVQAISRYGEEIVQRGADEVSCSVENGFMLHDWAKVQQSPVFRQGFRPMTGHDVTEPVSEHATVQMKREQEEKASLAGTD